MTRKALGRGLEALIPTRPVAPTSQGQAQDETTGAQHEHVRVEQTSHAKTESDTSPREIAIERITPNRYQPRQHFDAGKLEELAESMRQNGILQPLLVTPRGDGFELVAGERRLRAARLAGFESVPVLVREVEARESLKLSILENVQREDLNPIEEALGYKRLIDEFQMTQQDLGDRLGRSRSAVANALRLLQLPSELQRNIQKGELTAGHARALLSAKSVEEQTELATLVREQGLSVREAEEWTVARHPAKSRRKNSGNQANPILQELEKRLESRLGTRVRIRSHKLDGSSGRITIDYYSASDLERVFEAAGVPYLI